MEYLFVTLLIKQMIVVGKILGDFFTLKSLGLFKKIAVAVLSQSEKISLVWDRF